MLRMPEFEVHLPKTHAEAVHLRSNLPDAMYVAGGTDLLPNLKHQLHTPKHLVSLQHLEGFSGIDQRDSAIVIGAGTPLQTVADSSEIQRLFPGLSQAAASVAGPQHRRMGTLGGNVMLDTRCLFYNQSLPWRQALGFCLKKDGDWCHVVGSKATCVAAQSSDTVPMLIALGASVRFEDTSGSSLLSLEELFEQDGRYESVHATSATALLTEISIPMPFPGQRSVYRKVRQRQAIDFPQLGIGIASSFENDVCTSLRAVVGALMPRPRMLKGMERAVGRPWDDALIADLAQECFQQVRPQRNLQGDPAWRRQLAKVEMERGLRALLASS